jgi:transposase InsO family protein
LIKGYVPERAHQLWVSDITYIETAEGFGYLSLITDAYSRKIVGWELGENLESKHTVKALEMALKQLPKKVQNLYHHSDRGVQYCCDEYVKLLRKNHIQISMTETGDPLENAIAERINGILKDEWLFQMKLKTRNEAKNQLEQIIRIYNEERPHSSLDMITPHDAHKVELIFKKHWKNYYKKNENTKDKIIINSFIGSNENRIINKP